MEEKQTGFFNILPNSIYNKHILLSVLLFNKRATLNPNIERAIYPYIIMI
jgi:hypothetical protein